jgi:hypothetical protein
MGEPIGGFESNGKSKVVELDESKFKKMKYSKVIFSFSITIDLLIDLKKIVVPEK